MQTTNIEWTEMSVNPFRARDGAGHTGHYCEKVSAGCANCYASAMQVRFQMPTFPEARTAVPDLYLDEAKLMDVLRRKKPTKIFWCDMTDMFAEFYPDEWIDKCFAVMALTPQHTHQVLTKRPERMREYMTGHDERTGYSKTVQIQMLVADYVKNGKFKTYGYGPLYREDVDRLRQFQRVWPFKNVWLGVSVEDQKTADERIPLLLQTPAAVRWISAEPLLEPITLQQLHYDGITHINALTGEHGFNFPLSGIGPHLDWVVVGGESGAKARPFNIQWAREIIDQCRAAGVACFVKQLGSEPYWWMTADPNPGMNDPVATPMYIYDRKGGDPSEWPEDLRVREFPEVA